MALAAVNRIQGPTVPGAQRFTVTEVTFSASYGSEGEPCSFEQLGLKNVVFALPVITNGSENEAEFPVDAAYYTPATQKIHLINSKTSKEVASGKNTEKVKAMVLAFGS